jgi:hypothetical protein
LLPVILLIGILHIVIHVNAILLNAVAPKVTAPEILLLKNVRRKGRERWSSFFPFFSPLKDVSRKKCFLYFALLQHRKTKILTDDNQIPCFLQMMKERK